MKNSALTIFLQIAMTTGLLMVVYLLVMPVVAGIFGSEKLVTRNSVLEIDNSLNSTQRMVVTRARNILNRTPNALVEVVASGNGVSLLTTNSTHKQAILSLMTQGVVFTACQNSLKRMTEKALISDELLPGVRLTEEGHRYAEQLKDNGYIDELA